MANFKKSQGFTLVELLTTIAIISLLATLAITAFGSAKEKARDVPRLADVRNIKKGLEFLYDDHIEYEIDCVGNFEVSNCDLSPYLNTSNLVDPKGSGTACNGSNTDVCNYTFWTNTIGSFYYFYFYLEGETAVGNEGGDNCVTNTERIACAEEVSFNFCRGRATPDDWDVCSIWDMNQDGEVNIVDLMYYGDH